MTRSLTDTLCTQCGLCCDGSLFADVELTGPREAAGLELLGLTIDEDDAAGSLLSLPCVALEGRRCSIYAHRPQTCRTFECKLLQDARRGSVSVDRAVEHIQSTLKLIERVRRLMARLGERGARLPLNERCSNLLMIEGAASPQREQLRAELAAAMTGVQAVIRKTFLGGGRRGSANPRRGVR